MREYVRIRIPSLSVRNPMTRPAADLSRTFALRDNPLRVFYALVTLAVLVIIVSWSDTMLSFSTQKSDDVFWGQVDSELFIMQVIEGGVGEEAGLRQYDRVVAINDVPITGADDLSAFAQGVLNDAPTDRPIPYVVERQGQIVELEVTLTRIYIEGILIYPTFALLWLLVGFIAVLARPRGRVQSLFFATGATVFFTITSPVTPGLGILVLWSLMGAAFLFFWLLFTDNFPVRQRIFETAGRRIVLGSFLALITMAFLSYLYVFGPSGQELLESTAFGILRWGSTFAYGIAFTTGIFLLVRGYFRLEPGVNRRPMQIVVLGTIISALTLVYVSAQAEAGNVFDSLRPEIFLPTIPVLALPLSFGYAIFRYQLMDVRSVFRTTLVYLVTTGAILGLYLAIALNIGDALGLLVGVDPGRGVEIVFLLCALLLFEPVRRTVARVVVDRFFPEYSDYSRSFDAFSNRVSGTIGVASVTELVRRTISDDLSIAPVGFLFFDAGKTVLRPDPEAPITETDDLHERLGRLASTTPEMTPLAAQQDRQLAGLIEAGYHYAIPMQAGGRTTGLLLIGSRSDGREIRGSQISFLRSVASQTASAVEAERLYKGELERRRVQQELETARRIQETLLPGVLPTIDGVRLAARSAPARTVGGDYYDVIELDADRFLLLIADVSGKGLPASLYMAELHGMVRIVTTADRTPSEMLRLLDERLSDVLEPGAFVTATIAIVERSRRRMIMARAGHTPTLLLRDRTVRRLAPQGLPLGIGRHELFTTTIEEITVDLESGDRLFFFSDGVTEAMDVDRTLYGDHRLERFLVTACDTDPSACVDDLFESLAAHRGEAEQNDDITMLLLDLVEEPIEPTVNGSQALRSDGRDPEREPAEEGREAG